MWIASSYGFFSIVLKEGRFHLRARLRADLEALRAAAGRDSDPIEDWPTADYRYRILAPPGDYPAYIRALMNSVDYANFKDHLHDLPLQHSKLEAYYRLWHALSRLPNPSPAPNLPPYSTPPPTPEK